MLGYPRDDRLSVIADSSKGGGAPMPTSKVIAALKSLLPNRPPATDKATVLEALAESVDRRERNSQDGGEMIRYLNETLGMSYREISDELTKLGRPMGKTAIGTWANKPPAD